MTFLIQVFIFYKKLAWAQRIFKEINTEPSINQFSKYKDWKCWRHDIVARSENSFTSCLILICKRVKSTLSSIILHGIRENYFLSNFILVTFAYTQRSPIYFLYNVMQFMKYFMGLVILLFLRRVFFSRKNAVPLLIVVFLKKSRIPLI